MRGRKWEAHETQLLRSMREEGCKFQEIADKLNRTFSSVQEQWRWNNRDEDQKQQRRDRINLNRNRRSNGFTRYGPASGHRAQQVIARPTETLLEERERRLAAPRTLSQRLLGDPAPGYSALDRKRQRVPA